MVNGYRPRPRNASVVFGAISVCAIAGCSSRPGAVVEQAPSPQIEPAMQPMPAIFASSAAPEHTSSLALFGDIGVGTSSRVLDESLSIPGSTRRISFAQEGQDIDPELSPDGRYIYFASTAHRTTSDIYVKAVEGSTITQLTNDAASDAMPSISPDGARLAFASNRGGSWDIFVMNATGGQAVQITSDDTQELHPTWSPDGKTIAYCKLGEVSGRWEIWTTDVAPRGAKRFLTNGLFPDWKPDGNIIAFQRARERGDYLFSIWTLEVIAGEATNLTEIAASPVAALVNPAWSADGKLLAFAAIPNPDRHAFDGRPASADIWTIDLEGGTRANLTGGGSLNLMPAWGADNAVYFTSDRGGVDNIWSVDTTSARLAATGAESSSASMAGRATAQDQEHGAMAPRHSADHAPIASAPTPPHAAQPMQIEEPELANVPVPDEQ